MCGMDDHRLCTINNGLVSDECPECRGVFVIGCCWFVYCCGHEHKEWILTKPFGVESAEGVILPPEPAEMARSDDAGTVKI